MNPEVVKLLRDNGCDIDEVRREQERLTEYFERDEEKRFEMVGVAASGFFGITWKLKYRESAESGSRYIILKTVRYNGDPDDSDMSGLENPVLDEREYLKALRWAKHVISGVEIKNDPLRRVFDGVVPHNMLVDSWLYTEWIENGTLFKLIRRARGRRLRIPNRILWRFFMCLIRMIIAMGWPPAKPDGDNPQPIIEQIEGLPRSGLIHHDMHEGNIMLGDLIPTDPGMEHKLTPMLQLIDLGSMRNIEDKVHAVRENVFDMGITMLGLITVNEHIGDGIFPSVSDARHFQLQNGPRVLTNGHRLLPGADGVDPFPLVDAGLRHLVCACLATLPHERIGPPRLYNIVAGCIRERDHQFYASRWGNIAYAESDEGIRRFLSELVFNA